MGFSSNLLCSSCDLLALSRSHLEVCGMKIGEFPQVPTFVRSDKPKMFRGLQIKYVRGSDPVLKLLDDNGNIAEELSILKWNTDSVEEFLSEKLERI
ncbi:hypothetical protein cypCar_00037128 [Cyprinus carpio]|nr:hypothetical protein cypCar_00037128 [Cyprinus carpio]